MNDQNESATTHLARDAYLPLLNCKFRVGVGSEREFDAELIKVSKLRSNPYQQQFSLLFLFPLEEPVQQQMYEIRHESLGEFPLFLVPVAQDDKGTVYQAVFNRLIDQA